MRKAARRKQNRRWQVKHVSNGVSELRKVVADKAKAK